MKGVNKVILLGNLGKDPEVKYTPQGTPVATFSIATAERFKDKAGEWQERAEWHNIQAWGRLAEICGEYLHKGSKVYIEGRLKTDSWDDKQSGVKKYMTRIVAHELIMLTPKDGNGGGDRGAGQYQNSGFDQSGGGYEGTAVTPDHPITDDDIPF